MAARERMRATTSLADYYAYRDFVAKIRDAMQYAAEKKVSGRIWVSDEDASSLLFELHQRGLDITPKIDGVDGDDVVAHHLYALADTAKSEVDHLTVRRVGAPWGRRENYVRRLHAYEAIDRALQKELNRGKK